MFIGSNANFVIAILAVTNLGVSVPIIREGKPSPKRD